jgi:hypothetical protein
MELQIFTSSDEDGLPKIEEMDKVFISIIDGSISICYWKGDIKEIVNPNPTF